ncbi:hypothetical protein BDW74DRAFT_120395 [Aspergillus multicolor]|uniref:uncharacterized protein n=1 Tax=Aspergillus multicolor TaxID=41759 RepID=UPI003CCDC7B6
MRSKTTLEPCPVPAIGSASIDRDVRINVELRRPVGLRILLRDALDYAWDDGAEATSAPQRNTYRQEPARHLDGHFSAIFSLEKNAREDKQDRLLG